MASGKPAKKLVGAFFTQLFNLSQIDKITIPSRATMQLLLVTSYFDCDDSKNENLYNHNIISSLSTELLYIPSK